MEYMEHPHERRPGVMGLDAATGDVRWATPALEDSCDDRDGCQPGFSAPVTVLPGAALVVADDMVYVLSGYGAFAGTIPGNVLLALSVER